MEGCVTETAEHRLKRMAMRSWRRGTKEMDLILGPFADARLATLDAADLDLYELLLEENDQDLIGYVLGQTPPPEELAGLLTRISSFARQRLGSGQ
jgi:antitoxin CptB